MTRLLLTPSTEELIRAAYAAGHAARGLDEAAAAGALAAFLAAHGLPPPVAEDGYLAAPASRPIADAWIVGWSGPLDEKGDMPPDEAA